MQPVWPSKEQVNTYIQWSIIKKEGHSDTYLNVDEPWAYYAKSQKDKYCVISLIWYINSSKVHRNRN